VAGRDGRGEYGASPVPETPGPHDDFGSRRAARERALELLYEAEIKGRPVGEVIAALPVPPAAYATALATGAEAELPATDALLGQFSHKWEVHRMPAIDRAVLRLAVGELRTQPDVPVKVVLNEAVDLAKRYSTEQSGKFVNGLLSRIAREVRPGELE
jgi:N utilization substance protein B